MLKEKSSVHRKNSVKLKFNSEYSKTFHQHNGKDYIVRNSLHELNSTKTGDANE